MASKCAWRIERKSSDCCTEVPECKTASARLRRRGSMDSCRYSLVSAAFISSHAGAILSASRIATWRQLTRPMATFASRESSQSRVLPGAYTIVGSIGGMIALCQCPCCQTCRQWVATGGCKSVSSITCLDTVSTRTTLYDTATYAARFHVRGL
jgi:hypothetical protein